MSLGPPPTTPDPTTSTPPASPTGAFGVQPQWSPEQATQLLQSAAQGYGTLPDPQIATEAMGMGATPVLSSALASSDPNFESAILAQPVGSSQFSSMGMSPPTALFNDPWTFDQNQYNQQLQAFKKLPFELGQSANPFNSMNALPMANRGWFNTILNGDPSTIRQWQQFLADRGFFGQWDSAGKQFSKGQVSGYTSPQFAQAMQQWALAYFLPQAVMSRDPQEMTNARQFLGSFGYSPDAIAQTMANNPKAKEQIIDSWLQAQGPDANKMDALNLFAQHFGSSALPDQLNNLRGDFAFSSVGKFLSHVPLVGGFITAQQGKDLDEGLTNAEKELLNPALQQAHDQSGFMKTLGDVISAPSKALVTGAYFFGHAMHGDVENPFDASSTVRQQADTFVANPMRVWARDLLGDQAGDQWITDHPGWTTLGNIVANIGDDPLSYIPFVGSAKLALKMEEQGAKLTSLEKATGGLVSHRIGALRLNYYKPTTIARAIKNKDLVETLQRGLDPIGSAQSDVAAMLAKDTMTHGLMRDILGDHLAESGDKIDKLMALKGKPQEILAFLRDHQNGYAHELYNASFLLNRHQYHKVLRNFDRVSAGKALHIWHQVANHDAANLVNLNQVGDAVSSARDAAMAAGVEFQKVAEFEDKMWHAPEGFERGNIWGAFTKEIETALDQKWKAEGGVAKFHDWRNGFRYGGRHKGGDTLGYAIQHDPSKPAEEMSWRTMGINFTKDVENGPTAAELNAHADEIRSSMGSLEADFHNKLDAMARTLAPEGALTPELREQALKTPEMRAELTVQQVQMRDLANQLQQMRRDYGGHGKESKSPAPVLPTQLYQWAHMPFTATEIMAYSHKGLRAMETLQHKIGIDKAMNFWKSLVLSKPSTLFRVMFGDETSRFHINLLLNDPATWRQYVAHQARYHGSMKVSKVARKRGVKSLDDIAKKLPPEAAMSYYALAHQGIHRFVPLEPGEPGYKGALIHLIQNHYAKTQGVKDWIAAVEKASKAGKDTDKAGKAALRKWMTSEDPQARAYRKALGIPDIKKGTNPELDSALATLHYDVSSLTHPDFANADRMHVFNWIKNGQVDVKQLADLEKRFSRISPDEYILPRIQGRPPVLGSHQGRLAQAMDDYHHKIANQWINRARARGWYFKYLSEHKRLQDFYRDSSGNLEHADATLMKWAQQSATRWVKRNTYQGARSAAGSELRSVAPFWGATANANRFYLHTLIEHPEVAFPALQAEQFITEQQAQGGLKLNVPGAGWLLSHLGMSHGDDFTFEPFNSLFLTREGLGGFVPGMGPVFNFGMQALEGVDPGAKDVVGGLPGMQYVQGGTPVLPWLENLMSAGALLTGHKGFEAPLLGRPEGYYNKVIDDKFKQLEANWEQGGRKGAAPTVADAERDVGVNRAVTGVAGFAAPLGLAAQDDRRSSILDAEKTWDPGMAAGDKENFLQAHADIADFFRYVDPSTPEQPVSGQVSKQDILARSPWVLAYVTGEAVSQLPGRITSADDTTQYRNDLEEGNIRTASPQEYLTTMRQKEETTQAWNEYDRLQTTYQEYLQRSGQSTNDPAAKAWRKQNFDPFVSELVRAYPEWGATFVKSTSKTTAGEEFASAPLYSVSTFNVLPQNPALETPATVLWRAALQRQQQAVSALAQVIQNKGSAAEKDMILNGLAQQLDMLAAQDPEFAAQISRYRYSSVNDLITAQAQESLLGQ